MTDYVPAHVSASDRRAIEIFIERLLSERGSDIVSLVLFGSKARGDDRPESDIPLYRRITSEGIDLTPAPA